MLQIISLEIPQRCLRTFDRRYTQPICETEQQQRQSHFPFSCLHSGQLSFLLLAFVLSLVLQHGHVFSSVKKNNAHNEHHF